MHACIALLHVDPKHPELVLSAPPRKVTITPRAKEINLEDEIGISLSIPANAIAEDEHLTTSFSGAYTKFQIMWNR